MAKDERWMQKTFSKNPGALHRMMGIPMGEKIPWGKLVAATKQKKNELLRKRAQAAMNAMRANK